MFAEYNRMFSKCQRLRGQLRAAAALSLVSLFLLTAGHRCLAQWTSVRPKPLPLTLVLVDGLTWAQLSDTRLTHLRTVLDTGSVALVSPGLPRPSDPIANLYASLSAGDVVNVKDMHAGLLQRQIFANGLQQSVKILYFGAASTGDRMRLLDAFVGFWRGFPSTQQYFILCGVAPPVDNRGNWDRLTPLVIDGVGGSQSILLSNTTHTDGVVALRDIAPTVLALENAPLPNSMTGSPAYPNVVLDRLGLLTHLDTLTIQNEQVLLSMAWFLGLATLASVTGGCAVVTMGWTRQPKLVCYLLRLVMVAPLALLLAPLFRANSTQTYGFTILILDVVFALVPSPGLIYGITALLLVLDALLGAHMIASSALSGYWLSGIRFYGIGNEFMGVLIGMALLAPVLLARSELLRAPAGVLLGLWFLLVVVVLSFPGFGAKAGGAVTSMATLGPAWLAVRFGKRPTWLTFFVSSAAGFVLVFVFALAAKKLNAPVTHIQGAVDAVQGGRLGYIKHIAVRKAKMAVKTVLTPGGIVTVAVMPLLYLFWSRSTLQKRTRTYLSSQPVFSSALIAGGWGILAAILFNDSGTVAAVFLFGAMSLCLLHELVIYQCASSPSMSAMSGSVSP